MDNKENIAALLKSSKPRIVPTGEHRRELETLLSNRARPRPQVEPWSTTAYAWTLAAVLLFFVMFWTATPHYESNVHPPSRLSSQRILTYIDVSSVLKNIKAHTSAATLRSEIEKHYNDIRLDF